MNISFNSTPKCNVTPCTLFRQWRKKEYTDKLSEFPRLWISRESQVRQVLSLR